MDIELLEFLCTGKEIDREFFENIQSVIAVMGEPDCILAFKGEVEIGWYNSKPDRMLEITVYEDVGFPLWYEKTTFIDEVEETEEGEVDGNLYELYEWLTGNPEDKYN